MFLEISSWCFEMVYSTRRAFPRKTENRISLYFASTLFMTLLLARKYLIVFGNLPKFQYSCRFNLQRVLARYCVCAGVFTYFLKISKTKWWLETEIKIFTGPADFKYEKKSPKVEMTHTMAPLIKEPGWKSFSSKLVDKVYTNNFTACF